MSKKNSGTLLRPRVRTESLSAASNTPFIYLTNIYPALAVSSHCAEARNSTVIKGSLTLCSHSLEVRTSINQIIKDDGSEGKELSAGRRRIMAREQGREREGRTRCRKPSHAKQAVMVMEGEEAPASTGERTGVRARDEHRVLLVRLL